MRTRIMLAAALVAVLALTTVHAQTTPKMMPGKGFIPALRLYSPLEPFFAKTWRPSEIELVK